jgi:hypothetical protein
MGLQKERPVIEALREAEEVFSKLTRRAMRRVVYTT